MILVGLVVGLVNGNQFANPDLIQWKNAVMNSADCELVVDKAYKM
jgi:hypothetical protein